MTRKMSATRYAATAAVSRASDMTVSPIHHETQLVTRSGSSTTPRANRPPNQYGWEFPARPAVRIRQMEEAVRLILAMWMEKRTLIVEKIDLLPNRSSVEETSRKISGSGAAGSRRR
jgi:hypothetical protein